MDPLIIIVIVVGAVFSLGLYINRRLTQMGESQKPTNELLEYLRTTNTRLDEQNKQFTQTLQTTTKDLNERLDNAAKVIGQVQRNIGEMSEIGRGMRELQEFLQSPKLRGNIGEQVLKELLAQMLPKNAFHLQYVFKSGEKVDAAIKSSAGIIPIDSKFPMDNFRKLAAKEESVKKAATKDFERDVRGHIDSISKKYILTEEGTIDYALMYVPSESVYYEIVNNQALFEYAGVRRVLPVSPTTFYAYMKAILMSFEGQKIEAQAKEILASLRAIQKNYTKVEDNLGVLQKHLTNAYNMMGNVFTSFAQLGQKITSTRSLEKGVKKE